MAKQQRKGPARRGRSRSTPTKNNCSKAKSTADHNEQNQKAPRSTYKSTLKTRTADSQENSIKSSAIPPTTLDDNGSILPATNAPTRDTTKDDSNETVKSAEKPPETLTYKSALMEDEMPMIDPTKLSTFLLQKKIHAAHHKPTFLDNDEDTVTHENSNSLDEFSNSTRMTMMFRLPNKKDGCSEEEAPVIAIRKMNLMLKTLTNILPCQVGPWLMNKSSSTIKDKDLLKVLPEDIDFVESYVFDYNRFISPGKTGYVQLHIFFSDSTNISEITSVIHLFKSRVNNSLNLPTPMPHLQ